MKKPTLKKLKALAQTPIEKWLVNYVSGNGIEDALAHLKEIAIHGCQSGVVSTLIYTKDCIKFYARFEALIWQLAHDYLEDTGGNVDNLVKVQDLPNFKEKLAWFSVELSAYQLLNTLELARS